MVRGFIDILNHQNVIGWVAGEPNEAGGDRFVQVFVDGKELGTVRANLLRPDLREVGISDGYSGFRFQFAQIPNPFADHIIELFDRDSGARIEPHPSTLRSLIVADNDSMLQFDSRLAATHVRSATFADGVWQLNVKLMGSTKLELKPRARNGTIIAFTEQPINNEGFLELGLQRKIANLHLRGNDGQDVMFLELLEDAAEAGDYEPVCHIALPTRIPSYLENITHENMARVSGPNVTRDLFAASGVNTAFRINSIACRHFGKPLSQFAKIHDWGIGSGRVAVPIKRMIAKNSEVSGSDVDVFNVEFGKAHYPDIEFIASPFYPQLPYKDGTFDLLYGISVFTHLTEGAQFAWLKELRRIVKPGAAVILTVHGEYGIMATAVHDLNVLMSAASRGISDQMFDMNLGPKLSDKKYYRSTFHTRKYIVQEWAEYFNVLSHYSCANVIVQDFVVLQAK